MTTSRITRRIAAVALAAGCVFGAGVGAATVATAAELPTSSVSATTTTATTDFDQAQVQFKNSTDETLTIDLILNDGSSTMRLTRTLEPGESMLPGLYAKLSTTGSANQYMTATVHYASGNTSKVQLIQAADGQQLVDASDGGHTSSVQENESDTMWISDNQTHGDDPTSFHKMSVERGANSGQHSDQANFVIDVLL